LDEKSEKFLPDFSGTICETPLFEGERTLK
jgi:hypothetical protein